MTSGNAYFLLSVLSFSGRTKLLGDPEVTANIFCISRNLPNTDTQNYSTDLWRLLGHPVHFNEINILDFLFGPLFLSLKL